MNPPKPRFHRQIRVHIALLCFAGVLISHCDRINISVAAPLIMRERNWTTAQMGWVFTSFFLGYTVFMVLTGYLSDRFGSKVVFGLSLTWWSLFTALTPLPNTILGMSVVRALIGIGESGTNPAVTSMLVKWFPPQEYSRATSLVLSGAYAGPIIALPLATAIASASGWNAIFYIFGSFAVIWLPLWLLLSTDRPETNRFVKEAELSHILSSRPDVSGKVMVPWRKIVFLPAFWGVAILHLSANWLYYFLATWLPTYLVAERKFSLSATGFSSALPFLSAWVGVNLFGVLIDRCCLKRNRTHVRKYFVVPFLLTAVVLPWLSVVTSPIAIVSILCFSMILLTSATPTINTGALELAPRYSGTFMGIQNCFANLAGVVVPVVTGYVAQSLGWNWMLWFLAGVIFIGGLTYIVLGKAQKMID